jgi:hypothetical protein
VVDEHGLSSVGIARQENLSPLVAAHAAAALWARKASRDSKVRCAWAKAGFQ